MTFVKEDAGIKAFWLMRDADLESRCKEERAFSDCRRRAARFKGGR